MNFYLEKKARVGAVFGRLSRNESRGEYRSPSVRSAPPTSFLAKFSGAGYRRDGLSLSHTLIAKNSVENILGSNGRSKRETISQLTR
jgi:hypothetical protein